MWQQHLFRFWNGRTLKLRIVQSVLEVAVTEDTVTGGRGGMLCTSIAQRGGWNYFLKQRDSPSSISKLIKNWGDALHRTIWSSTARLLAAVLESRGDGCWKNGLSHITIMFVFYCIMKTQMLNAVKNIQP